MTNQTEFSGRTALITGGTRGIGRAASVRLASEGARVALNYVSNEDAAAETLEEIRQLRYLLETVAATDSHWWQR